MTASPPIDITNPDTWPVTLTADHIAAIYHRTAGGIRRACAARTFVPAPFQERPAYLWRKSDVLRHVTASGPSPRLRRSA